MAKGRPRVLGADGVWRDGKAQPEQLKPELARLPSEIVTKDEGEENKAHELDERHIVDAIEQEWLESQDKKTNTSLKDEVAKASAPVGEVVPLSQPRVDMVIFRCIVSKLEALSEGLAKGIDQNVDQIFHVWFPQDNVNKYSLKKGNPPADSQRPKHLRGLNLVVDILCPPRRIRDFFEAVGYPVEDLRTPLEEAKRASKQAAQVSQVTT